MTLDSLSGLALHTSLLQCLVVWVTAVSGAPKASVWVVVMYTMNNHTTGYKRVKSKAFVNSWQECMWRGYHIYITAKTHIACFTHEVVTLVADKLRRQWLWDLTLLTACIMQPESQLPWCKTTWCSSSNNHNNIDNPQNICEGVITNVLNSK